MGLEVSMWVQVRSISVFCHTRVLPWVCDTVSFICVSFAGSLHGHSIFTAVCAYIYPVTKDVLPRRVATLLRIPKTCLARGRSLFFCCAEYSFCSANRWLSFLRRPDVMGGKVSSSSPAFDILAWFASSNAKFVLSYVSNKTITVTCCKGDREVMHPVPSSTVACLLM